jgi:hypothetical protein
MVMMELMVLVVVELVEIYTITIADIMVELVALDV